MNKVYSKIESINGSVITVKAKGVKLNELAEINTRFGKSLAEVNKIDGDTVSLQVLLADAVLLQMTRFASWDTKCVFLSVKICLDVFLMVQQSQETTALH